MLPAEAALLMAEDHLRREIHSAHAHSVQIWASSLGLYSMGGSKIPDPPEPPEW